MRKYTTVLAGLLRHPSRSDFGKAVMKRQADKGVTTLPTYDFLKQMVYGQLSGCFSIREIENSLSANSSKLCHAGVPRLKRSTFCDAMGKRDHQVSCRSRESADDSGEDKETVQESPAYY
jgi:hypothetical protein